MQDFNKKLERRRTLGRPGVNGRIILRWIFEKWDGGRGLDRSGSRQVSGCCECGHELSGSIKCGEFLEDLKSCLLLRKDSATWSQLCETVIAFSLVTANSRSRV
jgi:hypothetical protein